MDREYQQGSQEHFDKNALRNGDGGRERRVRDGDVAWKHAGDERCGADSAEQFCGDEPDAAPEGEGACYYEAECYLRVISVW